jgi:CMP-N,N'-diacetyllegionaminic acid synthase
MKLKKIAVIPARGGSKAVPLKNIKALNGKPLIEYTIETAIKANVFDKIIVSTDHDVISNICEKFKEVEIIHRPDYLSLDGSSTESAIIHACDTIEKKEGYSFDVIVTLEPTSPMRSIETIIKCSLLIDNPDIDSVVGVIESTEVFGKIESGEYKLLNPNQPRRRQDRDALYKISSTIFATKVKTLRKFNDILGGVTAPLIVKEEEAIDINTEFDFLLAEAIMQLKEGVK